MRSPLHDKRTIYDIIEEHIPREARVPNTNVVVLYEFVEEENFDQETCIIENEFMESIKMDEVPSYFYIFNEQEDCEYLQYNVALTISQVNKFKIGNNMKK
jgi:hypothetical protein